MSDFNADLIGLTATPGRQFGDNRQIDEDKQLANIYNNNKVSITPLKIDMTAYDSIQTVANWMEKIKS